MKHIKLFYVLGLCLALGFASCSGEDGTNGANGADGTNGTNGTNGVDGQDGANGLGFDELTKYGYVTMQMEGTRPDNEAFTDSTSFKFTPAYFDYNGNVNSVDIEDTTYQFEIQRFLSAPDDTYQETFLSLSLEINNFGTENQEVTSEYIDIYNYAVVGDDNKWFLFSNGYSPGNIGVSEFLFENVVFDTETNNLTFEYTLTVDGEFNDSTNEITIFGEVDVILLEEIGEDL